jgi:hypothetical protein
MTYQEALTQEINSLPPALLPEVLDFVLFLKIKTRTPDNHLSEKIRELQFQQELQALSGVSVAIVQRRETETECRRSDGGA